MKSNKSLYEVELHKYLVKTVNVIIDRPIGYNHNGIIYETNYGYITDLKAPDNEYQDAYVIGINKPLKEFKGKVIAIIKRINDIEDKLVVSEIDRAFSKEEILQIVNFQEQYFKNEIIIAD